jgi:hypothetical protein
MRTVSGASRQGIVRDCLRRNHHPGPYQLQAAINAVHADAPTIDQTDWTSTTTTRSTPREPICFGGCTETARPQPPTSARPPWRQPTPSGSSSGTVAELRGEPLTSSSGSTVSLPRQRFIVANRDGSHARYTVPPRLPRPRDPVVLARRVRRQGCSHPHPQLQAKAALSFTRRLRPHDVGVSHPARSNSASWRTSQPRDASPAISSS